MWPIWGPPGADRTQVGPMLAPWTLLSGTLRQRHDGWIFTDNIFKYIFSFSNEIFHIWLQISLKFAPRGLIGRQYGSIGLDNNFAPYRWQAIILTIDVLVYSLHWCHNDRGVSQITSLTIVYSNVYSGTDQRKHQSSGLLASVRGINRWPMNSPHKVLVTRKMFPFGYVIMPIELSMSIFSIIW